jgi:hypothetical protein
LNSALGNAALGKSCFEHRRTCVVNNPATKLELLSVIAA